MYGDHFAISTHNLYPLWEPVDGGLGCFHIELASTYCLRPREMGEHGNRDGCRTEPYTLGTELFLFSSFPRFLFKILGVDGWMNRWWKVIALRISMDSNKANHRISSRRPYTTTTTTTTSYLPTYISSPPTSGCHGLGMRETNNNNHHHPTSFDLLLFPS